jgi:hypothetical protein
MRMTVLLLVVMMAMLVPLAALMPWCVQEDLFLELDGVVAAAAEGAARKGK